MATSVIGYPTGRDFLPDEDEDFRTLHMLQRYFLFFNAKAALSGGFCLRDAERYCTGPNGGRYWFPAYRQAGWRHNRVAGAGIEPASGGSSAPTVSSRNGLYHNPIRILPL